MAKDTHQTPVDEATPSPVAPLESVPDSVEEPTPTSTPLPPPTEEAQFPPVPASGREQCWNCRAELADDGNTCPACGFDKSLLFNLHLEAAKATERQTTVQQANK